MKTKYAVILGTVTTVLVSGSFIAGKLIESNFNEVVEQLNSKNQPLLKVLTYNRGVFSSDAELVFDNGSEKLVLVQKIKHGPLILGTPSGLRIHLGMASIQTTPKTDLQNKLNITTLIGFNKSATSWVNLKNIDDKTPQNLQVNWNSVRGEFTHDLQFNNLQGSLKAPLVKFSTDEWVATLKDFNYKINSGNATQPAYTEAINWQELNFVRNNVEMLNLSNTTIARNSTISNVENSDQKVMNYVVLGKVEHAKIVQQEFTNEQFEFVANNIAYTQDATMANMLGLIINPRDTLMSSARSLSQDNNAVDLKLEFPKQFSGALLSYLSFEIYRTSPIGKIDKRPEAIVMRDISSSVNGLLREAIKLKVLVDRGNNYALNFDLMKQDRTGKRS